jgi:hypothetical protein
MSRVVSTRVYFTNDAYIKITPGNLAASRLKTASQSANNPGLITALIRALRRRWLSLGGPAGLIGPLLFRRLVRAPISFTSPVR